MEISNLNHYKAIGYKTCIVTTVHEMQIIAKVPIEEHDEKINMIVTPKRIIMIN